MTNGSDPQDSYEQSRNWFFSNKDRGLSYDVTENAVEIPAIVPKSEAAMWRESRK
jgi:hypothetical protein